MSKLAALVKFENPMWGVRSPENCLNVVAVQPFASVEDANKYMRLKYPNAQATRVRKPRGQLGWIASWEINKSNVVCLVVEDEENSL